jgi:hypothetical protein
VPARKRGRDESLGSSDGVVPLPEAVTQNALGRLLNVRSWMSAAVLRHFTEEDGDLKSHDGAPDQDATRSDRRRGHAPGAHTMAAVILEAGSALAWRAPGRSAAALALVR